MKLLSATLRNYRTHREISVDLDSPLVLIHGPNEAGKSTLAEAIHRALFLKATTGGEVQKLMLSRYGGIPTIELHFEADGKRHTLRKQFNGTSGTVTLGTPGFSTLTGEAAEEALSKLLQVDGAIGGHGAFGKLEKRWGHLWVWQGTSDSTPLSSIEESKDQLRAKLQASSGQSILSSTTDNAVIQSLEAWKEANFTKNGFKANSDLANAANNLSAAEKRVDEAREKLSELQHAAESYEQAEADFKRHSSSLRDAQEKLREIDQQLKTVADIRQNLKDKTSQREEAEKHLKTLQASDAEIRDFETRLNEAKKNAAPQQSAIEQLREEEKSKQSDWENARHKCDQASTDLDHARNIAEAWQSHGESLRQAKRIEELDKQIKKIRQLEDQIKQVAKACAPLELFTEPAIKQLAASERYAEKARLKLEAYALQVEVLAADQAILLDGQTLQAGNKQILSHTAELQIGNGTRIRLNPGGAQDLEDAMQQSQGATASHAAALKELGVDSLEAAREQLQKRLSLDKDLETLKKQLASEDATQAQQQLDEAEKLRTQLQFKRDVSAPKAPAICFPDDLSATESALTHAQEELNKATEEHRAAEAAEQATRVAIERAREALAQGEEAQNSAREEITSLSSKLNYMLEKSGDSKTRSEKINQSAAHYEQIQAAETDLSQKLEELGADQLELNSTRLSASIESDRQKQNDANTRQITAKTQLSSSGTLDPERELKQAEADAARCLRRFDQLKHQADVRCHLLEKLLAARQTTTAALTQPLENAVNPYLKLLFGDSRAHLHWSADGSHIESFELDRSDRQERVYFEHLSHGTREQVALALRLAMAQLLAADHQGSLPVVLDDAFTHADKDRLEKLKSLLFQASQTGLQILLLSCHPENYSGLNAAEVHLSRSNPAPQCISQTASNTEEQTSVAPLSATAEPAQSDAFLEALKNQGGQAGNATLRQVLGWEEGTYTATKQALLDQGKIQTGRGGSVSLT